MYAFPINKILGRQETRAVWVVCESIHQTRLFGMKKKKDKKGYQ